MAKKQEQKSTVTISKNPSYDKHKLRLTGLDLDRSIKFNKGEKIEVTLEELNAIGRHRWLIIGESNEQDTI